MNGLNAKESGLNSAITRVHVLLVSSEGDHPALERMFTHTRWQLFTCERVADAVSLIESRNIGVVICRENAADGTWEHLVSKANTMSNPPKIILASTEPSTKLWNKALQAGADYVLSVPFDSFDVLRSVGDAWHRWWFGRVRVARFDTERKQPNRVLAQVAGQLA